ncbi:MAG: gliding motility-associated C-terminal domain-containing protein [Saprospiraceae bacterium]
MRFASAPIGLLAFCLGFFFTTARLDAQWLSISQQKNNSTSTSERALTGSLLLVGPDTICAGLQDTLELTVSTGTPPYTFIYSINGVRQPSITTNNNPHRFLTPALTAGQNIVRLDSLGCTGCTGISAQEDTITVLPAPTATILSDTFTLCAGLTDTLRIKLSGPAPYTFQYSVKTDTMKADTLAPITTSDTLILIPITPPVGSTVYKLTSVSSAANGCAGTVSGTVMVNIQTALTATISGGGQICQGGSGTTITVSFTGAGPYTFFYRAGPTTQAPITTNQNPFTIAVNPPSGTFYQLDSVKNGTCTGTVSGFALVAVFTPSTAELVGDITACSAIDTFLLVDFTGSGPFLLEYAIDGVVQPIDTTEDDPFRIPVNVTDTTTYTLISVESPGCFGSVVGSATVFINYPPELTNLFISCDLVNQEYTIDFDAIGVPPFTVTGVGGTFTGDHFTSDPIPLNDPYTLLLNDVNNCGLLPINGFSNCFCLSYAGDMDLAPVTGCVGDTAFANFLGFEELEVEDTLLFYLHTNSNDTLGTVLDIQAQPVFVFQPGVLTVGTTYYISPVAGNNNGLGGINLNDPCLSVTPGTPIVWREVPTATMSGDQDICVGETVLIPVTLTGTPDFGITYTSNNDTLTAIVSQNTFTISATLLDTTTFTLLSVANAECPGTVNGVVNVNVHTTPQIENLTVTCAPDNLSYTIEFDVQNADLGTVLLTGATGGSFNTVTGHFTGDPIPAQTPYAISVTDTWQCGMDTISGVGLCPCTTDAGMMDQTPLELCAGDTAFAAPAVGSLINPVDTLFYVLATTTSPTTWIMLASGTTPTFTFNPATMTAGTTYYIFAIAGFATATGVDLNHPCTSISVGSSVVWQPVPTATLGFDLTICQGDSVTLVFSFTGNGPYTANYTAAGIAQTAINSAGNQALVTVKPTTTTAYVLTTAAGNGCPATVSGSATVTVNPLPQITNDTTICNLATQTYTVSFDVPNVPTPLVTGLQGTFSGTRFTSDSLQSGQSYSLTVISPDGCTATLSGTGTCSCVTDAGTMSTTPVKVCLPGDVTVSTSTNPVLAPGEELRYILYQNPATLPSGIIATNTTPVFAFQTGMQTGTTYFISAIAGLPLNGSIDPNSPCFDISNGQPVVFHNRPTASLSGDTTVCTGASVSFKVQFTGTAPFQFVYTVNSMQQPASSAPQNSFTIASNNVQQNQTYTLISVQDLNCTGTATGTYTITKQDGPTASIGVPKSICLGDSAVLTLQLAGATSFDVTLTGGPSPIQLNGVQTGAKVTVFPTATTTYTIGTLVAQNNNCQQTIGPGVTITVSPPMSATATLSDYGGFNVSCDGETDGSITLSPSGGTSPINAVWSPAGNGLQLQNIGAGTYMVTLTDNIGCTYTTSFSLNEPELVVVELLTQDPDCFGDRNGSLSVEDIQGGVGPYTVSLDGGVSQVINNLPYLFASLGAGNYTVTVEDLNGCEATEQGTITDPPLLTVDLGPDLSIYLGDSVLLDPIVGGTFADTFVWTPITALSTPMDLSTYAKPTQTSTYKIWVQNASGCQAQDEIRINVSKERRLYIPNVLMQGGEKGNDVFAVFAGPEVTMLRTFRIYDRWGECVFERNGSTPNDLNQGWDGKFRGQDVLPGVYVYVIDLLFADGKSELKWGDVTVLR